MRKEIYVPIFCFSIDLLLRRTLQRSDDEGTVLRHFPTILNVTSPSPGTLIPASLQK